MLKFAHIVVAAVVLTGAVSAQQKPNFSGRWAVVSPPKGVGEIQVVAQDETTLSFYFLSAGANHRTVYQLDGVERRLGIPGQASITTMVKAGWEGNRIVVSTNDSYPTGAKIQSKDVWSIDAQGRLVIDHTESDQNGHSETKQMTLVKKS